MRLWGSAELPAVGSSEVQSSSKAEGGSIGLSNKPPEQANSKFEQEERRNRTSSAAKAEQGSRKVSAELSDVQESKIKPHRCNDRIEDVIQVT